MPHILWEKKYETGNEIVDGQHQQLFKLLNDLNDALEEKRAPAIVDKTLGRFALYVIDHFRDEEKLMELCAYPSFEEHKKIHEALTVKASHLLDKYREGDLSMANYLSKFLNDWITGHILSEDQKMFDWIRRVNPS